MSRYSSVNYNVNRFGDTRKRKFFVPNRYGHYYYGDEDPDAEQRTEDGIRLETAKYFKNRLFTPEYYDSPDIKSYTPRPMNYGFTHDLTIRNRNKPEESSTKATIKKPSLFFGQRDTCSPSIKSYYPASSMKYRYPDVNRRPSHACFFQDDIRGYGNNRHVNPPSFNETSFRNDVRTTRGYCYPSECSPGPKRKPVPIYVTPIGDDVDTEEFFEGRSGFPPLSSTYSPSHYDQKVKTPYDIIKKEFYDSPDKYHPVCRIGRQGGSTYSNNKVNMAHAGNRRQAVGDPREFPHAYYPPHGFSPDMCSYEDVIRADTINSNRRTCGNTGTPKKLSATYRFPKGHVFSPFSEYKDLVRLDNKSDDKNLTSRESYNVQRFPDSPYSSRQSYEGMVKTNYRPSSVTNVQRRPTLLGYVPNETCRSSLSFARASNPPAFHDKKPSERKSSPVYYFPSWRDLRIERENKFKFDSSIKIDNKGTNISEIEKESTQANMQISSDQFAAAPMNDYCVANQSETSYLLDDMKDEHIKTSLDTPSTLEQSYSTDNIFRHQMTPSPMDDIFFESSHQSSALQLYEHEDPRKQINEPDTWIDHIDSMYTDQSGIENLYLSWDLLNYIMANVPGGFSDEKVLQIKKCMVSHENIKRRGRGDTSVFDDKESDKNIIKAIETGSNVLHNNRDRNRVREAWSAVQRTDLPASLKIVIRDRLQVLKDYEGNPIISKNSRLNV